MFKVRFHSKSFLLCWSSFTSKITFTSKVLLVKLNSEIKQPSMVFGGYLDIWTAYGNFGKLIILYLFQGAPGVPRAADGNFLKIIDVWFLADIWIFGQLMVIFGN